MITFKKAKLSDIKFMQEIIKEEVQKGIILPRSDDEVATNIRSYTLAFEDKLLGFAALHFHTPKLAEVRSLVVTKEARGKTIGSQIVEQLLAEAKELEISKVFTLTYKKNFFERLGFVEISKEELPEHKIWADCIKCKHFPICDEIALIKEM